MKWDRPDPMTAGAMFAAALMIAQMVAAKAVRDSVFLSHFPATDLPAMTIAAAAFAIAASMAFSRGLGTTAPARFSPFAFMISAALQIGEYALLPFEPKLAACLIFLHVFGLNPVLTSSFWSMMNEHFDPSTARKVFSRIAGMGTVGGLFGGLLAERVAVWFSAEADILLTAFLHLACGLALWRFAARARRISLHHAAAEPGQRLSVVEALRRSPYLAELAALVISISIAASLVDYVFKSQAAATIGGGPSLTRFFALFYTVTSFASFLVQTFVAPALMARLGLAATVTSLPLCVAAGGGGVLVFFSLGAVTALRGLEVILRGSLFRSGYELFYTPLPSAEKRAAKSLIDVGGERTGDALGSGIVALLLALHIAGRSGIVMTAMGFALAGLLLARRLERAYIGALEKSLAKQSSEMEAGEESDDALHSVVGYASPPPPSILHSPSALAAPAFYQDPLLCDLAELRSGDAGRVSRTLSRIDIPHPLLCPQLIQLLAEDAVAILVLDRLRRAAPQIVGQLADALLDGESNPAVRRRIPSILAASRSQRAADALLLALSDDTFEIRFRCARALDYLKEDQPAIRIDPARIWIVVAKELKVGRDVWEGRQLLRSQSAAGGEASLECLFTLLGLVLPREPVSTAYRALHTEDRHLRGTALEYLQTVLPTTTWKSLEWLIADQPVTAAAVSHEEAAARLMASLPSILVHFGRKSSK